MHDKIINQKGNIITQDNIRDEIIHTIEKDLTHTYYEGKKITIEKSTVKDGERVTIVTVEGI